MKRLLKIVGITLLLLLLALIVLPFAFKGKIVEEVKNLANENIDASLEFEDVGLSLLSNFPNLTLSIDNVALTNNAPFEGVRLAVAENLEATINLASLFGDVIEVKRIAVSQPVIDVRVLEDGSANYDIAVPSDSTATEPESAEAGEGGFSLALREYTISGATLHYVDATMPFGVHLENLDHQGEGDFTAEQFTLSTRTSASQVDMDYDGVDYISQLPLDLQADLDIDLANSTYTFGNNVLKAGGFPLHAEGFVSMPGEDIEMDISFDAPGSSFKDLISLIPAAFAHELDGVNTTGKVAFSGFVKGIYNEQAMPGFGLSLQVDDASLKYPDLPGVAENIGIDLDIDASEGLENDAMTIDLNTFHAEMSGNPLDAVMHVRTPYSDPTIDGSVNGTVDLQKLAGIIPLEGGDELSGVITTDVILKGALSSIEEERYESFEAKGQVLAENISYRGDSTGYDADIERMLLAFSPEYLDLREFSATMDESDVQATGRMDNYLSYFLKDEVLKGSFSVNSNFLDVSAFMEEEETTEVVADSSEAMGVIEIPRNVDFLLNSNIGRIKYSDIDIRNASGAIRVNDGEAKVEGLRMELLEGVVLMDGSYATSGSQPLVDMDFDIRDMDIKQSAEKFYTIEKMAPLAKSCQGRFSTILHMETALNENMEPIEDQLSAFGRVKVESVFIEKFEPLNKLAEELKIQKLAKQRFEDLNIGYKVKDGKVIVDPFEMKMDGIPTTVSGSMTFAQELDYRVKMDVPMDRLPGNLSQQTGGVLGQINDRFGTNISASGSIPVTMRIQGTVTKPTILGNPGEAVADQKEDLKEQAVEEVKELVNEKIDEGKEEAIQKAREEADQMIAEAREQSEQLMEEATKAANDVHGKAYAEAQKVEDSYKNPFEKAAKRLAADQLRKKADQARDQAIAKARQQADGIVDAAEKKAEGVIEAAENK